jgi:OPA family glycerol-3-phosphate transporter-like MFS transporter/OPA family sugar phosphate sensor protein UhpC-like MFS transporter
MSLTTAHSAAHADEAARFRYWQRRTLIATMVGYAAYYFVRKNLSVAMPAMQEDLGITKTDLGLFLTLHGLIYGVSKFANGFLGDRANARTFMIAGLLLSAMANVVFGFSSAVLVLGLTWMANGWVQGMGFPPCARLMTHWYHPGELATKMSIWNTSHSIGGALVVIFCGYVVAFGWRWAFLAPAALVTLVSLFLWYSLRDTPRSVGLPEIRVNDAHGRETDGEPPADFKRFVRRQVFGNPYIWIIAVANFFVYTFRYGVLDWGPTLLTESKGISLTHASWMVAGFEIAGILGMLATGWITDRFFGGRGSRTCVFCMALAALCLLLFWKLPSSSPLATTFLLGGAGFFIYGPQALVGITAANLATKHAAATAVGFTGLFGYLSTIVSGWGLGFLAHHYGWNLAIGALVGTAVIGTALFLIAWPARSHGYGQQG